MQYDEPFRVEDSVDAYVGLNFAREAITRVYQPKGTKTSPGYTCRDIKEHNPDFKSGDYFIDPNGDSAQDAILVYCKFDTLETCIKPGTQTFNGQRWTKNDSPGQYFMEELNNGKEFYYKIDTLQLKALHLRSEEARQTITYSCLNSNPFGTRLTTSNDEDIDSAMAKHKRKTTIQLTNNCEMNNQWSEAHFHIRTQKAEMLPIVDMLLFDIGKENQKFGIEIGMACFK